MNPKLNKVALNPHDSVHVQQVIGDSIIKQWHYHIEREILCIQQGTGKIFIGDHVCSFKEGDVFMIGSNVPHMLRPDPDKVNIYPNEIVFIHLCTEALSSFISLPENKRLHDLFFKASRGIKISGSGSAMIGQLVKNITYTRETERLIQLLQIMDGISKVTEFELVSRTSFDSAFNKIDDTRLKRIYNYTLLHFQRNITLKEVAALVCLCPHSFCRYFKSRTRRSYSSFLTEIRLGHACKLLSETHQSIGAVAYESGFMNVSNFNRQFKFIIGKTPLEYRKLFTNYD